VQKLPFIISDRSENMAKEKRMAGDYEIIHAIHIGDKEVVFGIDNKNEFDLKYLCSYYTANEIFDRYDENMVSGDYLEIMKLFCGRVNTQIEAVKSEQEKMTVPLDVITAEMCFPNDYSQSIEGKVVAIKESVLRNEYQTTDRQLVLVTGGFGAAANSRGTACFTTNLYSGKNSRWERYDIQGEVRPEHMPQWAKEKLAAIQSEKQNPVTSKEAR
jgi:hypothetical protein